MRTDKELIKIVLDNLDRYFSRRPGTIISRLCTTVSWLEFYHIIDSKEEERINILISSIPKWKREELEKHSQDIDKIKPVRDGFSYLLKNINEKTVTRSMNKYNLDKIVMVEVNDLRQTQWYQYKKEKKFFGIVIQKEGVYSEIRGNYLGFEAPEYHTIKENAVYEKPNVIIHYEGGYSAQYYFDSFNEANKFSDEITEIGRWHII